MTSTDKKPKFASDDDVINALSKGIRTKACNADELKSLKALIAGITSGGGLVIMNLEEYITGARAFYLLVKQLAASENFKELRRFDEDVMLKSILACSALLAKTSFVSTRNATFINSLIETVPEFTLYVMCKETPFTVDEIEPFIAAIKDIDLKSHDFLRRIKIRASQMVTLLTYLKAVLQYRISANVAKMADDEYPKTALFQQTSLTRKQWPMMKEFGCFDGMNGAGLTCCDTMIAWNKAKKRYIADRKDAGPKAPGEMTKNESISLLTQFFMGEVKWDAVVAAGYKGQAE